MVDILNDYMSVNQLILIEIYAKKDTSITIEELQKKIEIPRSTLVDHIESLKKDGFIIMRKEGRIKRFYPVPEISDKIFNSLQTLRLAYVNALGFIREKQLKEIEKVKKKGME
jgi:DNA-binding MarR family transcriptional regulator